MIQANKNLLLESSLAAGVKIYVYFRFLKIYLGVCVRVPGSNVSQPAILKPIFSSIDSAAFKTGPAISLRAIF